MIDINKKIYILNGVGTAGKGEFVKLLNQYIPIYKYSIVDLPKQAAEILGWDKSSKTEKDRRFLSDLVDLSTEYNDMPFRDVASLVLDFQNNSFEADALFIDIRNPKDIKRAVKLFDAETILIRNPKAKKIKSNHADRDVEKYKYDYIIENNGTLEQLGKVAKIFAKDIIQGEYINRGKKSFVLECSKY